MGVRICLTCANADCTSCCHGLSMNVSSAPATSASAINVNIRVHKHPIKKKEYYQITHAERVIPIQLLFACEDFFVSLTEPFTLVTCFSAEQRIIAQYHKHVPHLALYFVGPLLLFFSPTLPFFSAFPRLSSV